MWLTGVRLSGRIALGWKWRLFAELGVASYHVTKVAEHLLRLLNQAQEEYHRLKIDGAVLYVVDDSLAVGRQLPLESRGVSSGESLNSTSCSLVSSSKE